MVGAVVVDSDGVVVGRGAHLLAGGPHAEMQALSEAGERAKAGTLYCTLEPCSHFGRTGPCAPRVIEAGIRRAVIAMQDPNPLVAGKGIALLRDHGIDVTMGVGEHAAKRLNPGFVARMRLGRPFVTMKVALTLDGCVALAPGVRSRLTGPEANRLVHRERAEVDALVVGSGTVLTDDPLLTPRGPYRHRPLLRVVLDRRLRTPPDARLLSTHSVGPVIIISTPSAAQNGPERLSALSGKGARVELIDGDGPPRSFLSRSLKRLAEFDCSSVVVEGGPTVHDAFWRARLVDRVQLFITPHVAGDEGTRWDVLPVGTLGTLADSTIRMLGDDVQIEGHVHRID
jgi:diaminohydroxyphosphoribosylaminopyrimidine deaminase / 5-amino-6-(5-phosphoribosylamino)uracil reductase